MQQLKMQQQYIGNRYSGPLSDEDDYYDNYDNQIQQAPEEPPKKKVGFFAKIINKIKGKDKKDKKKAQNNNNTYNSKVQ